MAITSPPDVAADAATYLALQRVDQLLEGLLDGLDADGDARTVVDQLRREHARLEPPRIIRPDAGSPVRGLARAEQVFGLTSFERDALLVALAPELDDRYGAIFARFGGRRPTVGLVVRLLGHLVEGNRMSAAAALGPGSHLDRCGLVDFVGDGPHASRELRIDDSVWPRLVGRTVPTPFPYARPIAGALDKLELAAEMRARVAGVTARCREIPPRDVAVVVTGPRATGRGALASAIASELGTGAIAADATALEAGALRALAREARWERAAILLTGVADPVVLSRVFEALPVPVVCVVDDHLLRDVVASTHRTVVAIAMPPLDGPRRAAIWARIASSAPGAESVDLDAIAARCRVGPADMASATRLAVALEGRLTPSSLRAATRASTSSTLATRIEGPVEINDLVVPAATRAELELAIAWAKRGRDVFHSTGTGARLAVEGGPVVLCCGPPGTGKTLAARIVARAVDRELLRVDLSRIVDKYVGETEKNLDRVLAEAERCDAILFFDEADALFGKRSEVKEAHDRYANVETGFLLQRMESHRGMVILATNLDKNMDAAFRRRIHVVVDFPMPQPKERLAIWQRQFDAAHLSADVDFGFLATRFTLAGGDIRNAAIAAAVLAAEAGASVGMRHLVVGAWRELRKSGRLIAPEDLGAWAGAVDERAGRRREV
jgi:hypothetical protein